MEKRGHRVIFQYQPDYDLLLVSPSCLWRYLINAKKHKKPILHRLDGVFYPSTIAGWRYPLFNLRLQTTQLFFTNFTVYQSKYSIRSCKRFLKTQYNNPSTLVYNGVDINQFSPTGKIKQLRKNPQQHIFITTGCFRRLDQVLPLIESFNKYRQKYYANSRLIFIGNYVKKTANIPNKYQGDKHILFMNTVDNNNLPAYLRAADIFLFSMQNSACPNNILEAMACELPVCGIADGSMPELTISGTTSELTPAHSEAFYYWRKIDTAAFAHNMNTIMQNHKHYTQASRQRVIKHFDAEDMTNKYLTVINHLLKKDNDA